MLIVYSLNLFGLFDLFLYWLSQVVFRFRLLGFLCLSVFRVLVLINAVFLLLVIVLSSLSSSLFLLLFSFLLLLLLLLK